MSHYSNTSRVRTGSASGHRPGGGGTTSLITDLPYGPTAAEVARGAMAVALHGATAELIDDARLIGSELATNAVTAGSPPLVLSVDRTSLTSDALEIEIAVTDGGCSHPVPSTPPPVVDEEAESGRGLVIVEALADSWSLTTGTDGTRAWCRLTRGSPPSPTGSDVRDSST